MKKIKLLYIITLCSVFALNAQEKNMRIGLATSYEVLQTNDDPYDYYGAQPNRGFSYGIEYTETKGIWGYRAGVFYTKIKDQVLRPSSEILFIDDWFGPKLNFYSIDFPLSGQIYVGKKRLKAYGNLGLINSMSYFKNHDYDDYYFNRGNKLGNRSISFRYMYGMGLTYQFGKHIGLDVGVNRKKRLYTFEDHYIKPRDVDYSFQTTINYIF